MFFSVSVHLVSDLKSRRNRAGAFNEPKLATVGMNAPKGPD
jgi:hypothetical protein